MGSCLKCPVCGGSLEPENNSYFCKNRHCFDRSKSGYVNLLQSNSSSDKRHGDDKAMLLSRRSFLEKGYYDVLCQEITSVVSKLSLDSISACDIGCGEGYYLENLISSPSLEGKNKTVYALDISKEACNLTAKRLKGVTVVVAGMNHLPFLTGSFNLITSIFAPVDYEEASRVLIPGGYVIKAIPLERHLISLKEAVYDSAYENKVDYSVPFGFGQRDYVEIKTEVRLEKNDLLDLFRMTPYYYKTSRREQEKLMNIDFLNVQLEFGVFIFQKR